MRLFTIFILLFACSVQLQAAPSLRDSIPVKKLLADIAAENIYQPEGIKVKTLLQTKRGDLLERESPYDLLKICMENQNAVVRLYAFKALSGKMDNLPKEAVTKFKNDDTPVIIQTSRGQKQLPVWQIANGFLK